MSYQATTSWMLVSSPGDVPTETIHAVFEAAHRWTRTYGKQFTTTVIPVAWGTNAVAAIGDRPQALINDQLTDQADLGVAIFRDKVGSPTGEADSGTWEEITRMRDAGKPVAILLDESPRTPASGQELEERKRLEAFIKENAYPQALVMRFSNQEELARHVEQFIAHNSARLSQRREDEITNPPTRPDEDPAIGVWPRIENDASGGSPGFYLVLSNETGAPARDVHYEFVINPGQVFDIPTKGAKNSVPILPPGREHRFPVFFSMGSTTRQALCRVTWTDHDGNERTTEATVTA